jgi:transketolase
MDLRKQFFTKMNELAEKDPSIILIVGDLGYSFMEEYQKKFPKQFLNCGIMEQAMVGISAGMALAGLKPYVYSGSIFLIARAYEQIRDDVAYNNLNVKLIGTGASPFLGFSHNWLGKENEEDLLKNLPNLKRFYPEDEEGLNEALTSQGCAYIRI